MQQKKGGKVFKFWVFRAFGGKSPEVGSAEGQERGVWRGSARERERANGRSRREGKTQNAK